MRSGAAFAIGLGDLGGLVFGPQPATVPNAVAKTNLTRIGEFTVLKDTDLALEYQVDCILSDSGYPCAQRMERLLFGTDGVRGLANAGSMTPEIAFRLGAAITFQAHRNGRAKPRIIVGKDTRLSGYLFETAIASGICALGGRTLLCGPLPTPAVAHATTTMRADAGIVISASHNPYQDNGIKIFGADGFKLPDQQEVELERLIAGTEIDLQRPVGTGVGSVARLNDAAGRYVDFVKATFPQELRLDRLRIVVDAANGAAYRVAAAVFEELGAEVFCIGNKPNGRNINDGCGALFPEACATEVRRQAADLGIALDGDADRLIVVDDRGEVIDGDAVMALCAQRMLQDDTLQHRTLVATVMSNLGLEHALARHQGRLLRCQVGDRYVVEAMRQGGYNLGGEQSGHMIFMDHTTTGDGLVSALQLLAMVISEQRPVSELAVEAMQRVPQILVNVHLPERRPLENMQRAERATRDAILKLGNDGRVLVRWSGTEPLLRIMIEGPNEQEIAALAQQIAAEAQLDVSP